MLLAWSSVLLCLALNVHALWGARWPAFPYDEVQLLQMARLMAGQEVADGFMGRGYFPAWSVLTTPVWWFTSDPFVGYRATLWAGVPVALVTIWPLALLVRRFALATAPAVVVASFAMMLPARVVQADFAMSERLVTLAVVLVVLAAARIAERPTVARHVVFALLVALLYFSHVRMGVIVIAAAVWLAMRLPRHPWVSSLGLVLIGGVYVGVGRLGQWMNELVLLGEFRQDSELMEVIGESRPSLLARVAAGQAWQQVLASYGLAVVGFVVLVILVWRELRRWEIGVGTFVLGATSAVTLVSLLHWANAAWLFENPWVRLDVWVYGRYVDPVVTVVVAMGLAALLRRVSRSLAIWSVGGVVVTTAVAVVAVSRGAPTWGYVTPAHIPGILPWHALLPEEPWPRDEWIVPSLTNENQIWLVAPLCVLTVLVAVLVLARRPLVAALVLLSLAAAGSVVSSGPSDDFHASEERWTLMRDHLQEVTTLTRDTRIGFLRPEATQDDDCSTRTAVDIANNSFSYAVVPAALEPVLDVGDAEDLDLVIACERWSEGERRGARRLDAVPVSGSFLWVMPGPLADDLQEQDRLVPPPHRG